MIKCFLFVFVIFISLLAFANDTTLKTSKMMGDCTYAKIDFCKEDVQKYRNIKSAVLYFSEGFEYGIIPPEWTVSDGNNDGFKFEPMRYTSGTFSPASDDGGTYFAEYLWLPSLVSSSHKAANDSAGTTEELTSPSIFIGFPMTELTLMYDYNKQDYYDDAYFATLIRTFDGAFWSGWTQFAFHSVDEVSSDTLSLDSILGADSIQINILFHTEDTYGAGMGIDNIELVYVEPDNVITPPLCAIPQTIASIMHTIDITSSFVRFDYAVSNESNVKMDIFSMNGSIIRTLVNGNVNAGTHTLIWDTKDNCERALTSGSYIYKFTAGAFSKSGKLTLVR